MADPTAPPSNGASSTEPKRSLRDVLEESWDKVVENAPDYPEDDGGEPDQQPDVAEPVDSGAQPRDESGRWIRKDIQPGEAAQPPQQAEHPAPPEYQQPNEPHPAPISGEAAQPPANWSAEDRANFEKLPEGWARDFILRRHSEIESFAQQRIQASAAAANFANGLAPIFNDPRIQRSLQEAGVGPAEAINQWAGFHLRFLTDPVGMVRDLAARAGIDPAALAGPPAGQPPAPELKDPGLRYLADHLGRNANDIVQMRNELRAMQAAAETKQQQDTQRVLRWGIDSFADETDQQGNKLRPDFDELLPFINELYRANPRRDLRDAYSMARRMSDRHYQQDLENARRAVQHQQSDARAAQAVRSNARGRTHPVLPPPRPEGQKRTLRETLEAAADAVGLE